MSYCRIKAIGDTAFTDFDVTVAISAIEQNFNVLDGENAGRVMTGRMVRDVIGTYVGHKVTFFNGKKQEDFDALWDFLIQHSVDEYVTVQMADSQGEEGPKTIEYQAYYTSGKRTLKSAADGVNVWDEIEINFIPMEAWVRPE